MLVALAVEIGANSHRLDQGDECRRPAPRSRTPVARLLADVCRTSVVGSHWQPTRPAGSSWSGGYGTVKVPSWDRTRGTAVRSGMCRTTQGEPTRLARTGRFGNRSVRLGRRHHEIRASGCGTVLADKPTKDIDAFDAPGQRQHGHRWHGRRHRHVEVDAAVQAAGVVVLEVPGQDMLQVVACSRSMSSPGSRFGPCAPTARHTRSPSASAAGS